MPYSEFPAAPALRSLVACYWRITGPTVGHRVLPDGCIDILLVGDCGHAEVVGTMTRAIVARPSGHGVVGIRFRPGEAARVLPAAARELTDRDAPLSQAWADDVGLFEDVLSDALNAGEDLARSAARLDDALTRRLARSAGPVDMRIRAAAKLLEDGASVHDAARVACLSERQLARRFEARVGIGPKAFARVMRLQRAVAAIADGASPAAASTLAGYADQAHFTRDTRALAGVTPGTLARELTPRGTELSDSFKTESTAAA